MFDLQCDIVEKNMTHNLELRQEKSVLGVKTEFPQNVEEKEIIQNKGNSIIVPFEDECIWKTTWTL